MAGPIRGSIEHYQLPSFSTGTAQAMFVNCYNFLNNNTGVLGIQRIAYNTGSQDTGMTQFRGMNFFDQDNPAGQNAFACFRFLSASVPFDVCIQWTGGTSFGTAPGAPALINASTTTTTFAFSIAQSTGSTDPWNGTTLNNGNDRKGTPVWVSASNITYYPRSNDPSRAGAHGSSKQNMIGPSNMSGQEAKYHFVADYDNFVFFYDNGATVDAAYGYFMMLKYTPLSGVNPDVPYFAIGGSTIPITVGSTYGSIAGNSADNGGVSFPDLVKSGTIGVMTDRLGNYLFTATTCQPNKMYATQKFDEFPIFVGGGESPGQIGMLGQHSEFVREVYNIQSQDTNGDGTRAVIGGSTTLATVKMTIPWHSGTTPGTGVSRNGVQFGLNGG